MEIFIRINEVLSALLCACFSYQFLYMAVALLRRPRPLPQATPRRYAVLVCARNEEAVIGNLIDSVHAQRYPAALLDLYVCADNCTDATAARARAHGATVLERHNTREVGKGYAIEYLLAYLRDAGVFARYAGFFFFDADNLLHEDFVAEMNRTFAAGNRIVTGYRNSKNYGDNWLSAGYSLWFLRDAQYMNRPRMLLGTSGVVGGTGFLVAREVLEACGGWPFHSLTEDTEFTADCVARGERIGYCADAILYDEQPTDFGQSWRQRTRWIRGFLQVLRRYGKTLLCGMFRGGRRGFACFDLLLSTMPAVLFTFACALVSLAGALYGGLVLHQNVLPLLGRQLFGWFSGMYATLLFLGGLTLVSEWRRIYCSAAKKLLYLLSFPLFMMTYLPISVAALFGRVEWTPIRHSVSKTLEEVKRAA